jgi:hypothetical protein
MRRVGIRTWVAAVAVIASLGVLAPAAGAAGRAKPPKAHAATLWTPGQKLLVLYNNSPLRSCAADNCLVQAYMPASTGFGAGQGWVTSEADQLDSAPWCLINWKGTTGYTGCWRLSATLV